MKARILLVKSLPSQLRGKPSCLQDQSSPGVPEHRLLRLGSTTFSIGGEVGIKQIRQRRLPASPPVTVNLGIMPRSSKSKKALRSL